MEKYIEIVKPFIALYGLKIIAAVAIIFVGRIIAKSVGNLSKKMMIKARVDETLAGFGSRLVTITLTVFVFIAALGQLGVQTASFVAIIGAAGLAVGLALQGSLSNFAAGVMIIIFRPFKIGDFVEAGGASGTIVSIEIFNTIVKTGDNKKVIVPNSNVTSGVITNFSANDTRRVDMVFGIGYDDDINKARAILEDLVNADHRILSDPEPKVALSELADSSINFIVRPWVKSEDYWDVKFDMLEKVKNAFDDNGISIPYPQQDVHIHQAASS